MKIGFSTTCTFPSSLETSFKMGKEAGFDGIEIMISANKLSRDVGYLKELENKFSLPVLSFHAPTLLLTHFVWSRDPAVKLERTAELAAEMGSETVVVHPPYSWQKQYSENFLTLVKHIQKNTGVTIAVENMFPWRVKNRMVQAYSPKWETIVESGVNLTYDFSHGSLSGWNSLNVISELYPQIKHVHLCDGAGVDTSTGKDKIFDEHLLPGMGNQQVAESLQFLKEQNWSGSVVAEINMKNARNNLERFNTLAYVADWAKQHTN